MIQSATREQAHELIERIDPSQLAAAVDLLQQIVDPLRHKLANAPYEDEEISEEEEQAVARAKLDTRPTTSMEDLLAEYGITLEELRTMDLPPMESETPT